MCSVPGAEHQILRHERMEADLMTETYLHDKAKVEKELG